MSGSIRARIMRKFAVTHLISASILSRQLEEVEREHQGETFAGFFEEILALASGSIVLCAAALEAYANETFNDADNLFESVDATEADRLRQEHAWDSVLDKFDRLVELGGPDALDRGTRPAQDIKALFILRNALVHFTPEWDEESDKHAKVSQALQGRFAPSEFPEGGEGIYPIRWATANCTKWAIRSCTAFIAGFSEASHTTDRLAQFHDRLHH